MDAPHKVTQIWSCLDKHDKCLLHFQFILHLSIQFYYKEFLYGSSFSPAIPSISCPTTACFLANYHGNKNHSLCGIINPCLGSRPYIGLFLWTFWICYGLADSWSRVLHCCWLFYMTWKFVVQAV